MVVEIELALFINLCLNSFIIKLSSMFLRENARMWFLSSLLASIIAIILPLFNLTIIFKVIIAVCTCNIITVISFTIKNVKKFVITFTTIIFVTFLFGGGCYAVESMFGALPLIYICLIGTVVFVVTKIILNYQKKKDMIAKYTYNVILKDGDKTIYEEGYLDSGNILYDNITKKPIILVTFEVFNRLYQNINYINALTKNFDKSLVKDGHFVKINSIGSGTSILVFTIDEMVLNSERSFKNVAIGLSFSSFDKSFGKKVLLNSSLI